MAKSTCIFLCLCALVIGSYASSVSFIDKCTKTDKECLIKSSQKALPYFIKGIPEFGIPPLDPMHINELTFKEGELTVVFKDVSIAGMKNCKVVNVERNDAELYLIFEIECPIEAKGTYVASGKLIFAPIEGDGPFSVKTDKVFLSVKAELSNVDGKYGKHWKIGKVQHHYDVREKAYLKFENLFHGDKEKADPIIAILDQSWKELFLSVGKPIVKTVIDNAITNIQAFVAEVPASELEQ